MINRVPWLRWSLQQAHAQARPTSRREGSWWDRLWRWSSRRSCWAGSKLYKPPPTPRGRCRRCRRLSADACSLDACRRLGPSEGSICGSAKAWSNRIRWRLDKGRSTQTMPINASAGVGTLEDGWEIVDEVGKTVVQGDWRVSAESGGVDCDRLVKVLTNARITFEQRQQLIGGEVSWNNDVLILLFNGVELRGEMHASQVVFVDHVLHQLNRSFRKKLSWLDPGLEVVVVAGKVGLDGDAAEDGVKKDD